MNTHYLIVACGALAYLVLVLGLAVYCLRSDNKNLTQQLEYEKTTSDALRRVNRELRNGEVVQFPFKRSTGAGGEPIKPYLVALPTLPEVPSDERGDAA